MPNLARDDFDDLSSATEMIDISKTEDELLTIPLHYDEDYQKFFMASAEGETDLLRSLLKKGVNPSTENQLALALAAQAGHADVIDLLLRDRRVDVTARGHYALRASIEDEEAVSYMANHYAQYNIWFPDMVWNQVKGYFEDNLDEFEKSERPNNRGILSW